MPITDLGSQCLLGLLTKKFINLIKRAEDGELDLNKAADTLQVLSLLAESYPFWLNMQVNLDSCM